MTFAELGKKRYEELGSPETPTSKSIALARLIDLLGDALDEDESHITDPILLAWNLDDEAIIDCLKSIAINNKYKFINISASILALMLDCTMEERATALATCCGIITAIEGGFSLS